MSDADRPRVAVVTGGGSGIGQATAVAFARRGIATVIADVNESGLSETASLCADAPGEVTSVPTDVTAPEQVDWLIAAARDLGRVSAAVNCAGIVGPTLLLGDDEAHSSRLRDVSDADWARVLAINLTGVLTACGAR